MQLEGATAQLRIVELEAALASQTARVAQLEQEQVVLRASHERLRLELELFKRRLAIAKAERVDTKQLELEFAEKLAKLEKLANTEGVPSSDGESDQPSSTNRKTKPKGRRQLSELPLEEKRVEVADPLFEKLVEEGKAERCGHEVSYKLAWQRGGMRRLAIARVKYCTVGADGESAVEAAPMPKELLWRCVAAASLLAHIIVDKHCDGLPLFRIEKRLARDGVAVDRGTMSRWLEDIGATFGATIIEAMRKEALNTAFCIATDATGIAIQPEASQDRERQACRRGHFFVQVADKDAVFFEYTPRETSAAVGEMFKGFTGYVQADAKSVYDILYRNVAEDEPPDGGNESPDGPEGPEGDKGIRKEVACWVHGRRGLWEAAIAKDVIAREGLFRIHRIFELDASWAGKPVHDIHRLRQAHLAPHIDAILAWAEVEYEKVRHQRGRLRSALGYIVRQRDALRRVLDDGRLLLDNNRSERELRVIAVGRKAWLFCGSDDHAVSAGHLFTMIASARLHGLDPETYLRDILRVLPFWPNDRYLELAPKYWATTRARIEPDMLAAEVGDIAVPPPAAPGEVPAQQATSG